MAIAVSKLTSGTHTSNGSATASINPTAGAAIYVIGAFSVTGAVNTSDIMTVTGGGVGMTWSALGPDPGCQLYGTRRGLTVSRGTGTFTEGALTLTIGALGSGTFEELKYVVLQVTGQDTGTPNDAVVGASTGASATSLACPDVGTPDAGDIVISAGAATESADSNRALATITTELEHFTGGTGVRSLIVAVNSEATPDETPTLSQDASDDMAILAFIVNAAAGGGESTGTGALAAQAASSSGVGILIAYPAWGYATPDAGEIAQSWSAWHLGAGAVVNGDADYGDLIIPPTVTCSSPVIDTGDAGSKQITMSSKYGTNLGTYTRYIRGSETLFAWDDGTPSWTEYTGAVTQAWRYVQVLLTGG